MQRKRQQTGRKTFADSQRQRKRKRQEEVQHKKGKERKGGLTETIRDTEKYRDMLTGMRGSESYNLTGWLAD